MDSSRVTNLLDNQRGVEPDLEANRDQSEPRNSFDRYRGAVPISQIKCDCGFIIPLVYLFYVFVDIVKVFATFLGAFGKACADLGKALVDFIAGLLSIDSLSPPNGHSRVRVFLMRWLFVLVVVGIVWLFLRGPRS